jgi:heat shock protein HslJ
VVSKTGNVTASSLEGVSWSLDSLLNSEGEMVCALSNAEVTALFKDGRISGKAGCNNYAAEYVSNGSNLTIGPIISTLMMCVDEGVSRQESDYLRDLNDTASYNISGNLLRIMNSNGTVILTYSVVQPTPLTGTLWQMTSYNNGKGGLVSDLSSINTTAIFSEDGNLAGSAACNQYHTTYLVNDSQIEIGPVATTRMMCPEPVMQQEMDYLNALQSAASYEIQGSDLILFNANDTKAVTYQSPG